MMEVTDRAIEWMKDELEPNDDQGINIFVRYGGETQMKQGFSPGVAVEEIPEDSEVYDYDGLRVFIKEKDLWYFEDSNLKIDISEDEELTFTEE